MYNIPAAEREREREREVKKRETRSSKSMAGNTMMDDGGGEIQQLDSVKQTNEQRHGISGGFT